MVPMWCKGQKVLAYVCFQSERQSSLQTHVLMGFVDVFLKMDLFIAEKLRLLEEFV